MYNKIKGPIKNKFKEIGIWENVRSLKQPRLVVRNLAYRVTKSNSEPPIPPQHLMDLVIDPPEAAWYLQSGVFAFRDIQRTLNKNGINPGHFGEVLDFGCGTGRIAWRWKNEYNSYVYGTDYNKKLVNFCKKKSDKSERFSKNEIGPPLEYEKEKFSFIYANSVFTHLSKNLQKEWIKEAKRVLENKGYMYITVHGNSSKHMMNYSQKKKYDSGNVVVKRSDRVGTNVCAAFHPPSYVKGSFSEGFDVIDYIPNGTRHSVQDIYLFRKC
jgi:SAM-dependent methyltransferase